MVLIPRDNKEKGIVIEFKRYSKTKDSDLRDSAIKALKQIEREGYEATIKAHGVSEIIKVGIAFRGKKVKIVSNLDSKEELLSKEEQIAKNLLKSGVDIEVIAQTTGLSENEIKDLE